MSKVNLYQELRDRHQQEVNNFPIFFAFSKKQFDGGMISLGLQESEINEVIHLGGGDYIRKSDYDKWVKLGKKIEREMKEAIAADKDGTGFIYDMFYYELTNHEFCVTGDVDDTLHSLCLSIDEINKDARMKKALARACRDCYKEMG